MILSDQYVFSGAPEDVWNHLVNADMLGVIIPGCESMAQTAPDEYEAVVAVNMFLFRSKFTAHIKILQEEKPRFCRFRGEAAGSLGGGTVEGSFSLEDKDGKTLCRYETGIELTGSLAQMGGRVIAGFGKDKIRRSLEKIEHDMK